MSSQRSLASPRMPLLPVVAALALALAACSGGATESPADTTQTVDVTLQEWAVVPTQSSVKAGSVTFEVTNAGPEDKHEFVIFRTDLGARGMPLGPDNAVDEEGEGVELIGEIEEFEVGTTESATFELAPGKYVFLCNLVEEDAGTTEVHYQLGMSIDFTVE
jgi:uncharacterized cupredoxin-like copper-binding protein